MSIFPFSIADIGDPDHIRVVLYSTGRMGHAPLNALLRPIRDGQSEDQQCRQDCAQLVQRVALLEKKLRAVMDEQERLNGNKTHEKEGERR